MMRRTRALQGVLWCVLFLGVRAWLLNVTVQEDGGEVGSHTVNVVLYDSASTADKICRSYYARTPECAPLLEAHIRTTLLSTLALEEHHTAHLAGPQGGSSAWLSNANLAALERRQQRMETVRAALASSSPPLVLLDLATDHFNSENYEIALPLAYAALFSSSSFLHPEQQRLACTIIAEAAREQSREAEAAAFSLKAAYLLLPPLSSPLDRAFCAVHRLRALLSVPPLPPTTTEALHLHARLIRDLSLFTADLLSAQPPIAPLSLSLLASEVSATPFHLAHHGVPLLPLQRAFVLALRALCPELSYTSPALSGTTLDATTIATKKTRTRRLRLGFLSSYFFEHSVGKILYETLLHLTRTQKLSPLPPRSSGLYINNGGCDIYVLFVNQQGRPVGPASSDQSDQIVSGLHGVFGPNYVSLEGDVLSTRSAIEALHLDFLLFADVGMNMASLALSCMRLAPYQAAFWGHPVTTGSSEIDHFLSLDVEPKEAQDTSYSEQLVRMEAVNTAPLSSGHAVPRVGETDRPSTPAAELAALLGLGVDEVPEGSRVCAVLGRLFKLHPDFDAAVAEVLVRAHLAGLSVFLALVAEKIDAWNEAVLARLHGAVELALASRPPELLPDPDAALRAITARVRFLSYSPGYSLLLYSSSTAVALDTFPYGGCLTAHEALSDGLPLVTLPRDALGGRMALALYQQMDHLDLVAHDAAHYVALVSRLLSDEAFYRQQSRAIRHKFDNTLKQNGRVALEWAAFIHRLVT